MILADWQSVDVLRSKWVSNHQRKHRKGDATMPGFPLPLSIRRISGSATGKLSRPAAMTESWLPSGILKPRKLLFKWHEDSKQAAGANKDVKASDFGENESEIEEEEEEEKKKNISEDILACAKRLKQRPLQPAANKCSSRYPLQGNRRRNSCKLISP